MLVFRSLCSNKRFRRKLISDLCINNSNEVRRLYLNLDDNIYSLHNLVLLSFHLANQHDIIHPLIDAPVTLKANVLFMRQERHFLCHYH